GHQRKGSDVAGVMTALAAVLKNAHDFVAERRPVDDLRWSGMQHGALPRPEERENEGRGEDDAQHGCSDHHSFPLFRVRSAGKPSRLSAPRSSAMFPSTIVMTLTVSGSLSAGTRKMSCDRIATSATFPGASVP